MNAPVGPSPMNNSISHSFDLSSLSAEQQHILFAAQAQMANGQHPSAAQSVSNTSHQMNLLQGADALPGRGNVSAADSIVLAGAPQVN